MDNIPILDSESENFKEELAFNLWSTQSCTDYRNDRDRPYNGQSWTDQGERGKQEVKGLTMRDICDCYVKAVLLSNGDNEQYRKAEAGTWRYQDVYEINFAEVDPLAIQHNLTCEIEKMMGIFPNTKDYGNIF